MNEAMKNLLTRRSVRKYKPEQITDEELRAVLEAGTYAPTARGTQSPLIVAVQNAEDIALMSRLNAAVWGRADFDPFLRRADGHRRLRPGGERERRAGRLAGHGEPAQRGARPRPRLLLDKPRAGGL